MKTQFYGGLLELPPAKIELFLWRPLAWRTKPILLVVRNPYSSLHFGGFAMMQLKIIRRRMQNRFLVVNVESQLKTQGK